MLTILLIHALACLAAFALGGLWAVALTQPQLNLILMNQAELAAALTLANQQIAKIREEQEANSAAQRAAIATLTAEVDELTALLAAGTVTEDVASALASVKSSLQAFDDTIPDAPTPAAGA